MCRSIGVLHYSPKLLGNKPSAWWAVVECDEELGRYYRYLFWLANFRTQNLERPSWKEHVTVIWDEEPPNRGVWEKHAGKRLEFWYNQVPQTNGTHWWLDISCPWLSDLREELGLPREPSIPFHLSFGHEV